ncbi:MAG: hypothetical protein RI894_2225 [Bacteroidota bacterium]|jgi:hypothetical protein
MLPLGTIVRNLHTGDEGRIVALDGDFAIVELFDDHDHYPIPMQSLVRTEEFFGIIEFDRELNNAHKHKPKQKNTLTAATANKQLAVPIDIPSIVFQPVLAEMAEGLFLSFVLEEKRDVYMIFAINNTNYSLKFETKGEKDALVYWDFKHIIAPFEHYPIGELPRLALNELPKVTGDVPSFHKNIEQVIRAKSFFKTQQITLLDAHDIKKIGAKIGKKASEKAADKTEKAADKTSLFKKAMPSHKGAKQKGNYIQLNDLQAFASFPLEIDLHAERLFGENQPNQNDIFRKQLVAFERYIDQAIRLNMTRIHVIHGKGEGKLREAVHRSLQNNPNVSRYEIDGNVRYGGGATEVVF